MKPLFLASNSPRRARLLSNLGLEFEIRKPQTREKTPTADTDEAIIATVCENALRKALSILSSINDGLAIGGDTLVVTNNKKVLGKPKTSNEALRMLQQLVGKTHRVISAVAIVDASTRETKVGHSWATVTFRKATKEELQHYVLSREPLGKAGGYAIQGKGGILIESIEGSYTAIIGLPIELVVPFLSHFGVPPSQYLPP
jgi:septum formation protein